MPKMASWSAYFSATSAHLRRVLVSWGFMSMYSTSFITRMLSPPRIGSGQLNTGWSTQSDLSPGAWLVDEPSNPQIGRLSALTPSSMILVFERSLAVGEVPSTQMYSALYDIGVPFLHGG